VSERGGIQITRAAPQQVAASRPVLESWAPSPRGPRQANRQANRSLSIVPRRIYCYRARDRDGEHKTACGLLHCSNNQLKPLHQTHCFATLVRTRANVSDCSPVFISVIARHTRTRGLKQSKGICRRPGGGHTQKCSSKQ